MDFKAPGSARLEEALLEAAVLGALGDVVFSLQESPLPLQLARAERLGVHLVLCTKEVMLRVREDLRPGFQ